MSSLDKPQVKLNAVIVPLIDAKGTPLGLAAAKEIAETVVADLTESEMVEGFKAILPDYIMARAKKTHDSDRRTTRDYDLATGRTLVRRVEAINRQKGQG